jgi:hypothetical protein
MPIPVPRHVDYRSGYLHSWLNSSLPQRRFHRPRSLLMSGEFPVVNLRCALIILNCELGTLVTTGRSE